VRRPDLVLRGGCVIDPESGLDDVRDIAIAAAGRQLGQPGHNGDENTRPAPATTTV
jgi:hypothetical protein